MQLTVERDIKKISALNWDSVAEKENLFITNWQAVMWAIFGWLCEKWHKSIY